MKVIPSAKTEELSASIEDLGWDLILLIIRRPSPKSLTTASTMG